MTEETVVEKQVSLTYITVTGFESSFSYGAVFTLGDSKIRKRLVAAFFVRREYNKQCMESYLMRAL